MPPSNPAEIPTATAINGVAAKKSHTIATATKALEENHTSHS